MLDYSKEEIKSIKNNYEIPSKYEMDIIKNYGTKEAFVEAYKKCQCNYNFKNDIFCGFRGITISKNDITEYQKLQYALAIKKVLDKDINYFEFNTGKYIDIEQFEQMIRTLSERMSNVYRYYSAFDGKKYTMAEIGKMYNVSSQMISEIIKKAVRKLSHPSRSKYFIRDYKEDYKELEECNKEIEKLKIEAEDLQIINNYFSNEDYIGKNVELSNIIVDKNKLAYLNKENIINIHDLMQKYYNILRERLKEISIYELEFSMRTFNCLRRADINTLYDLINSTENEILKIRAIGKNSYNEIIDKLSSLGLSLKKNDEEKYFNESFNTCDNAKQDFISMLKKSLEKLEEIINKKDYIKNRIESYYFAVEQYINNEDIFNSEYIISSIDLKKENLIDFDHIKSLLIDLKIINEINNIKEPEKIDKKIPKIRCVCSDSEGEIFDIDELEMGLNKLYNLEAEWLVLEPLERVQDTIFLQIYIDENFKNKEKENRRFHIELGYENTEGGVTIYEKNGLTIEEALQIFTNYSENHLPELKDWHAYKYEN